MAYRVVIQPRALAEMEQAAQTIEWDAPSRAERWYRGIRAEIATLAEMPRSRPLAPEAESLGREVRHFHFHSHRVVFVVKDEEGIVDVLRVYHGAMRPLGSGSLSA